MLRVDDAEFKFQVKFPTGKGGAGRKTTRMLIDHPESPRKDYEMYWARVGNTGDWELVVRHVNSGSTIGVPRENVASTRPPLSELVSDVPPAEPPPTPSPTLPVAGKGEVKK